MGLVERMTEVFPYALIAAAIIVAGIAIAARVMAHVKLARLIRKQIAQKRCVVCSKMCDADCAARQRERAQGCTEFVVREDYHELAHKKWWQCFNR